MVPQYNVKTGTVIALQAVSERSPEVCRRSRRTALLAGDEFPVRPNDQLGAYPEPGILVKMTLSPSTIEPLCFPLCFSRPMKDKMKAFRKKLRLYALVACAAVTTACSSPGYNNNPSQQITNSRVGCLAATEFFAVYFTMHLQPSDENQDERVHREIFRSYCNDIPSPGRIFLTADLVGTELTKIPIRIRVMQHESKEDGTDAGKIGAARTIFEAPAKAYSSGVIESQFAINDRGYYSIYLMIKGGENSVLQEDELEIPLHVGVDSGASLLMIQIITMLIGVTGMALLGLFAFRYSRRPPV